MGCTSSSSSVAVPSTGPSRIAHAVKAMRGFITKVFGARDRCSITSFNSDVNLVLLHESSEPCVHRALQGLTSKCGGQTAMYDAICFAVAQFLATGDRSRPWMLIILTDGEDNQSSKDIALAKRLLGIFNQPHNNMTFVIGLGPNVPVATMRDLCSTGSVYIPCRDAELLQTVFVFLAISLQTQTKISITSLGMDNIQAIAAQAERAIAVRREPVDILILVDISGSMNEKG